jgi:putative sterol carrier protein
VTAYLSSDWLADPVDPAAEALAALGGSLRIARVVTKAPDGEARFAAVVADGTVRYEAAIDDPDVVLTDTYANALAILRGELDPNAAFVRGQTKVAGETGPLLELLAATKDPAYEAARARLAAAVDA